MNTHNLDEIYSQLRHSAVPDDFPIPKIVGSVTGAQPKLLLTLKNGLYYNSGSTPTDITERWNYCEDLVRQLVRASKKSKAGKRAHMPEEEILDQYLERLITAGWTSVDEAKWIIRRCASSLGWSFPCSADA